MFDQNSECESVVQLHEVVAEPQEEEIMELVDQKLVENVRNPQDLLRLHLLQPVEQPLIYSSYPHVKSHQTMLFTQQEISDVKHGILDEVSHLLTQYSLGRYKQKKKTLTL